MNAMALHWQLAKLARPHHSLAVQDAPSLHHLEPGLLLLPFRLGVAANRYVFRRSRQSEEHAVPLRLLLGQRRSFLTRRGKGSMASVEHPCQ